jgi:Ca2+-binding RTX toxin-like protein
MVRVFALLAIAVLAAPGLAHAGKARVAHHAGGDRFFFVAGTGEANQVHASLAGGTITFQDLGAPVTPGNGCNAVNANQVTCAFDGNELSIALGDLDDTASVVHGRFWTVDGGSGADTLSECPRECAALIGGPGGDTLTGGFVFGNGGNDTLTGSASSDQIEAGPGDDTISSGRGRDAIFPGLGDDSIDGGRGGDSVFFFARAPIGVTADLQTGVVTGGQGNDTLARIECLNGSQHDDHFYGDSKDNCFGALGGNDVVFGRGGADNISGGCCRGDDRLFGGSGPDKITAGTGDDVIDGGGGKDRLHGNRGDDRFRASDGRHDLVYGGEGLDKAHVDPVDLTFSVERILHS